MGKHAPRIKSTSTIPNGTIQFTSASFSVLVAFALIATSRRSTLFLWLLMILRMKYDIILWPRTCAVFRVHYHINAMKRCCERTRTARRRALCGRRRLRHAAAILLRQANGIAPAWYRRKPTNVTDVVRSFRRTTTNQPPFSAVLAELSCISLRLFSHF